MEGHRHGLFELAGEAPFLRSAPLVCSGSGRRCGRPRTRSRLAYRSHRPDLNAAPAVFELQGYELAVDEINHAGGLLGRKVDLVQYDDQGNPGTAVQLYQKLLTDDKVDLLVSPYQTDLTAAVAPI